MFRKDAPLLVNPRPDWHKLNRMAEFVRSIPNYEANTVETVRLALVVREHLFAWAASRPMIPNMLPREGTGKRPGVLYNTQYCYLGWTLAAATVEPVAEAVLSAQPSAPVEMGAIACMSGYL